MARILYSTAVQAIYHKDYIMTTKEYDSMVDRRSDLRVPLHFNMQIDLEDRRTGLYYQTHLINYSSNGVCAAWKICRTCSGYIPGAIHPDCIFSLYDAENENSHELMLYIHLPGTERIVKIKGKAVYTYRERGIEQIGIQFTEPAADLVSLLDDLCADM